MTAASSSPHTGDEMINLIPSVDPAYRQHPSFRLMVRDKIDAVIRTLKDSRNRPTTLNHAGSVERRAASAWPAAA